MKSNPNDTAFPSAWMQDHSGSLPVGGLTKREYFAALAMQGLLANSYSNGVNQPTSEASFSQLAGLAVNQADALIVELNKGES